MCVVLNLEFSKVNNVGLAYLIHTIVPTEP